LSATVKELLQLDNICRSYAQMKKSSFLTHSVDHNATSILPFATVLADNKYHN